LSSMNSRQVWRSNFLQMLKKKNSKNNTKQNLIRLTGKLETSRQELVKRNLNSKMPKTVLTTSSPTTLMSNQRRHSTLITMLWSNKEP
jgi:hypothetical protein